MTTAARPRPGVTADSIKVVVYIGDPAKNPLQAASVGGAGADVSPATAKETYQGYIDLFAKYYETYGRKVDLTFFDGTGGPMDEVAARADAKAIADMKPVRGAERREPDAGVVRRARGQRHHVPGQLLARRARAAFIEDHPPLPLRHRPDPRAGRRPDRQARHQPAQGQEGRVRR